MAAEKTGNFDRSFSVALRIKDAAIKKAVSTLALTNRFGVKPGGQVQGGRHFRRPS